MPTIEQLKINYLRRTSSKHFICRREKFQLKWGAKSWNTIRVNKCRIEIKSRRRKVINLILKKLLNKNIMLRKRHEITDTVFAVELKNKMLKASRKLWKSFKKVSRLRVAFISIRTSRLEKLIGKWKWKMKFSTVCNKKRAFKENEFETNASLFSANSLGLMS